MRRSSTAVPNASRTTRTLSEHDSKELLGRYGVPLVEERIVATAAEGVQSIARTAEGHAAAAQQVSAATQEQSAACEQMSSASTQLMHGSEQLRELVGALKG